MNTSRFSTPALNEFTSDDDDFHSAEEFLTPRSHISFRNRDPSPGCQVNPIMVESISPANVPGSVSSANEEEEDDEIPAPITHKPNGENYEWASLDSAFIALQEFAKENGFAVKKSTSKKVGSVKYWQLVRCVHGGQKNTTKVTTPNRRRISNSLIGDEPCQFRVHLKARSETNTWILEASNSVHNHKRQIRKSAYAVHRRNALRAKPTIIHQINADADALIDAKRSWYSIYRTNPDAGITLKDIRNARSKHASLMNGGLPAIQALIQGLENQFAHQEVVDSDNHLVHLLLFHRTSLQLLLRWPYTLVIDCTYKMNRHDLYLCQIVGKTARNTLFIIGQAFLSNEDKEAFIFVLNWLKDFYLQMHMEMPSVCATDGCKALIAAVKEVWPGLPHLLCLWHLYNDVEAYCKPLWRRRIDTTGDHMTAQTRRAFVDNQWSDFLRDFRQTIQAGSVIEYEREWHQLRTKWSANEPEVIQYLLNTWISQKERICTAWTSQYRHFGTSTTSAAESMHKAIKKDLPHRFLHLRDTVRVICAYIERQNEQIEYSLASETLRGSDIHYKIEVFRGLSRTISQFALNKVLEHVRSTKEQPTGRIGCCSNRFTRQWGLPCAHLFHERLSIGASLRIEDFHVQWRLDRRIQVREIDPLYLLKDPIHIRSRFTNRQGDDHRERSLFEIVRAEGTPVYDQIMLSRTQNTPTPTPRRRLHVPARTETLLEEEAPDRQLPLYLTSLGDDVQLGGFCQASEFVSWQHYHRQPETFAGRRVNEAFYAPEGANVVLPNEQEYEWSEDENEWLESIFGTDIIDDSTKDDLLQTRQAVVRAQQRRLQHYASLQESNAPIPVQIERDLVEQLVVQDRGGIRQGGLVTDCTPVQSDSRAYAAQMRRSDRQRRPKRHFDEVD